MKRISKKVKRKVKYIKNCFFCKQMIEPNYKEVEILKRYLSERGRILSRLNTGVCQKHQRRLTKEIKRARFLALLPFIVRPS